MLDVLTSSFHRGGEVEKKVGVVVVAAGYGMITPGRTKLVEEIDGWPMVVHALSAVRKAGDYPKILVVAPRFRQTIEDVLEEHGLAVGPVTVVEQAERRGAADALRAAVPALRALGCEAAITVFGDMPCWRPGAIRALDEIHSRVATPISMTLISVEDVRGREGFGQFGRVLVDSAGRVIGTFEPRDARPSDEDLARAGYLNAALYALELDFFEAHVARIPPQKRTDGHPDELHLPALVKIARAQGVEIGVYLLRDPEQARGVNTREELELAREVFARRRTAFAAAYAW
jgi:bifunctional N-acetylglucosamine-1-phosphate-uridyltransferase/glucosamine-1-phosphate-acetyltransferase GlmU-like protein